jgi:Tfp pilus assembly protein PilV
MELPGSRWVPYDGWTRLAARLREDRGVGLIELLIALLVLNVGIFATFAALTSGAVALRHASHVSTATALADQKMEVYRDLAYGSIPPLTGCPSATSTTTTSTATGADGRPYNVQVAAACGTAESTGGSTYVKKVTVTVTDPKDSTVNVVSPSTFSLCTQAALSSDPNPCQS